MNRVHRPSLAGNPLAVELANAQHIIDVLCRENDVQPEDIRRFKRHVTDAWERFPSRRQLNDMLRDQVFERKCAYCEVPKVTNGQIDHFWPKLAHSHNYQRGTPCSSPLRVHGLFVWENLFWSCGDCNSWSIKGSKMHWDAQGNPLLLNPCLPADDPFNYLEFVLQGEYREGHQAGIRQPIEFTLGWVFPKKNLPQAMGDKASYTIRVLKLNRYELVWSRASKIAEYWRFIQELDQIDWGVIDPQKISQYIHEQMSGPYAASLRQMLFLPADIFGNQSLYARWQNKQPEIARLFAAWHP